jgi:hypothetical protein
MAPKGRAERSEIRLGRGTTYLVTQSCIKNQPTSWLVDLWKHSWCWDKPRATRTHLIHHGSNSKEATTFPPYSILCVTPSHPHPNGSLSQDSQGEVPKLSRFGLSGLCEVITPCSDLCLGRGLKQTCSSPWKLSNGMLHSPCTH